MQNKMAGIFLVVACACTTPLASPPAAPAAGRIANLSAFARLYGVVRWFHPSDAAAGVDWDLFAADGVRRVVSATDPASLRAALMELFTPVAPTVQIALDGRPFAEVPALHPTPRSDLDVISWQHKGYGDSLITSGYFSKRRHREQRMVVPGAPFAALSQSIDASPYRGTRVRLRGTLRTAAHAQGRLWLRVDRGPVRGFFDTMAQHPVLSQTWAQAEIVGTVDSDATKIFFGALMLGPGTVWYDDLELSVETTQGDWKRIEIQDGDFESPNLLQSWHSGTGSQTLSLDGWSVILDHEQAASGGSSLRMEAATKVVADDLFAAVPKPGETVDVDLGSGLRARVAIALYSRNKRTIGDELAVQGSKPEPPSRSYPDFSESGRLADVVIFWNVFRHFWPYWNVTHGDWNDALGDALTRTLSGHGVDDHVATLERLSVAAPDGHVSVSCPGQSQYGYLPLSMDLVENQIVVTSSTTPTIKRGDVIVSVDGLASLPLLATEESLISGSHSWQVTQALTRFGRGQPGSSAALQLRRDGAELNATAVRIDRTPSEDKLHPPIEHFEDGIYYIDLARVALSEIEASLDRIAHAPGVIFDMRERPKMNHDILSHILTRVDSPRGWESIPLIVRPNSASAPAAWEDTSDTNMPILSVKQPHIAGKVAFLTGPHAISYSESVLALVEYYHLGEIVGAPTAGTNGDPAEIGMPSGCTAFFTGRRVLKPDGRQHHLIGVQPTIPVSRTLAGIAAGRDEVLERALAYVRAR